MNKKQYITPLSAVIAIRSGRLLQGGSETLPINKDDDPVTDSNEVYSRRRKDVWDDEEEEEY